MIRAFLILLLFISAPLRTHAEEQCVKPTGVMFLHSSDEKRLDMARALKAHLKAKGQDTQIVPAIYKASLKTGVNFDLMVLKAKMESDLGRQTVATGSSARGVFQYIDPTWLTLIRRYGDRIGYAHYADAIGRAKYPGVPYIKNRNPFLKAEILALRHDPEISALIKAYQVKEETGVIRGYKNGQRVTTTDHYIAHMLGLSLAKEFYAMKNRGSKLAVAGLNNPAMREAAKLNRVFFYDGRRALTAREAYVKFEKRVNREFSQIRSVSYKTKTPACIKQPPALLSSLESLKPLCSGFPKDLLQPVSLHATLHQLHPCARVRTH